VIVPGFVLAAGVLAFIFVALLTEAMRRLAIRHRLLDQPREDGRHRRATPYLGGVAIAGGTVCAVAIAAPAPDEQLLVIAGTATIVWALGLTDDLRPLNPAFRVIVECLCASALVAVGVHADLLAGAGLVGRVVDDAGTVAWIVVLTNSFNLLDNMDGAAAAIALATSPFLALLALATGRPGLAALLIAVAAGSAGFLVHNWPPARIFMGDSGSLFLGYVLTTSAVLTCTGASDATPARVTAGACALLLLTFVAVADTGTVLVSRWRAGRRWTQGGADHLAHRLRVAGLSTPHAALALAATAAVTAILGVTVISGIVPAAAVLAATVAVGVVLVALAQRVKVYSPDPQPAAAVPDPMTSGLARQ
jgi:UDP-GlcNAc:undecaprenyl-phosphate/decaprenyl-phosphate GlcNAc-1-phosphate transferase